MQNQAVMQSLLPGTSLAAGTGDKPARKPVASEREETIEAVAGMLPPAEWNAAEISPEVRRAATKLRIKLRPRQRVIAVTGEHGHSASQLATQLAVALATAAHAPVLLVEGEVVAPRFAQRFSIAPEPGFCDAIEGRSELDACVRACGVGNLFLLPVGATVNAFTLFSSDDCPGLLETMRDRFRYVVVDAGPVSQSAESMLLASLSDGVVISAAAGTRREDLAQLTRELGAVRASILGVMLSQERK